MQTAEIVVAKARPERTVKVTDDEVRRVVQAIEARGMSVYLTPKPEQADDGPSRDDVCCHDGIVDQIFNPITVT